MVHIDLIQQLDKLIKLNLARVVSVYFLYELVNLCNWEREAHLLVKHL